MSLGRIFMWFYPAVFLLSLGCLDSKAEDAGVHCRIDQMSFEGDASLTRIDYVVPPGAKPPRFRLLAGHANDAAGSISVQLKTKGPIEVGSFPLDQEATWKSVIQLPNERESAVTSGDLILKHFDPKGDSYAVGTVRFQTGDAHHGECQFRLPMNVVDLGQISR